MTQPKGVRRISGRSSSFVREKMRSATLERTLMPMKRMLPGRAWSPRGARTASGSIPSSPRTSRQKPDMQRAHGRASKAQRKDNGVSHIKGHACEDKSREER